MPLEFLSTNKNPISDDFFTKRINPTIDVANNVLKKATSIVKNPSDVFNVEFSKGDSLNSLANKYLKNSFAWQIIADANGLDPTKEIDLGKKLSIPKLDKLQQSVTKYLVESAQGKKLVSDLKKSVLNLIGIRDEEVAKELLGCADKIINFKKL